MSEVEVAQEEVARLRNELLEREAQHGRQAEQLRRLKARVVEEEESEEEKVKWRVEAELKLALHDAGETWRTQKEELLVSGGGRGERRITRWEGSGISIPLVLNLTM